MISRTAQNHKPWFWKIADGAWSRMPEHFLYLLILIPPLRKMNGEKLATLCWQSCSISLEPWLSGWKWGEGWKNILQKQAQPLRSRRRRHYHERWPRLERKESMPWQWKYSCFLAARLICFYRIAIQLPLLGSRYRWTTQNHKPWFWKINTASCCWGLQPKRAFCDLLGWHLLRETMSSNAMHSDDWRGWHVHS